MDQASVTAFFDEMQKTLFAAFAIETRDALKARTQLWGLHDAERQKRWEGLKIARLGHNLAMVQFINEKQEELQTLLSSIRPVLQRAFADLPSVKVATFQRSVVDSAFDVLETMKDWHETESHYWEHIDYVDSNWNDCNVIKATERSDDEYAYEWDGIQNLSFELERSRSIVLRFVPEESLHQHAVGDEKLKDKKKPSKPKGKGLRSLELYEEFLRMEKSGTTKANFILLKNRNPKDGFLLTDSRFEYGQSLYNEGHRSESNARSGIPETAS
jgi:hypothetical protein